MQIKQGDAKSVGLNARDAHSLVKQATGLDPSDFVKKFGSQFQQLNPKYKVNKLLQS